MMPKKVGKVERANSLDDAAYQAQFVPDIRLNKIGLQLEFTSAGALMQQEQESGQPGSDLETCFELIKATSYDDYKASSIGWSSSEKRKEMRLPDMRYLLVRDIDEHKVQGFVSFMVTYEDGSEVIYIYEIHLAEQLRARGLGSKLVVLVEEIGRRAEMSKVMLTVFASNRRGLKFYEYLGYQIDDCSPGPRRLRSGMIKQPDYRILSKPLTTT